MQLSDLNLTRWKKRKEILIELNKTPAGIYLILDALEQSEDPEWQEFYDSEIRAFPDPKRRKRA